MKASLWHEAKSPLTAARLGLQLLKAELEEKNQLSEEAIKIISQIDEKIGLTAKRILEIQEKFEPKNK